MPTQPGWYSRVEEILTVLGDPSAPPVVDRQALERLFRVRRRQAIRLMGQFGGYQAGKTFLVERSVLIAGLRKLVVSGAVGHAVARKRRILAAIHEVSHHAAARRSVFTADEERRQPEEAAGAVRRVGPGRIEIRYQGAEDLLARIAELATAAADDFALFQQRFEGGGDGR